MKHEIVIIDTGLDRMTGPRETNDVSVTMRRPWQARKKAHG